MIVTNPFSPGSLTRETINTVASGWWVLLLSGIVGVVAGGIILFTDWTVSQLVTFVGLLFIFRGVLTAVSLPVAMTPVTPVPVVAAPLAPADGAAALPTLPVGARRWERGDDDILPEKQARKVFSFSLRRG